MKTARTSVLLTNLEDIKETPWAQVGSAEFGPALTVPTMLAWEEQQFYWWLAAHVVTGQGCIVDLGCFIGGSTARMAAGAQSAGHGAQIHAYDRFTVTENLKKELLYAKQVRRFNGPDMFNMARELLAPFAPNIHFHRGEITQKSWSAGLIELLTLDASKTRSTMDAMAQIFFPGLQAGKSMIVQQDFLHVTQPWVPIQMELWADHFTPLAYIRGTSMAYRCDKTPTGAAALERKVGDLTHDDQVRHLEAALARLADFGPEVKTALEQSLGVLKSNPDVEEPWNLQVDS